MMERIVRFSAWFTCLEPSGVKSSSETKLFEHLAAPALIYDCDLPQSDTPPVNLHVSRWHGIYDYSNVLSLICPVTYQDV